MFLCYSRYDTNINLRIFKSKYNIFIYVCMYMYKPRNTVVAHSSGTMCVFPDGYPRFVRMPPYCTLFINLTLHFYELCLQYIIFST